MKSRIPNSPRAQRTLAHDFDGVFHSYKQGWTGPVPLDPPVEGAAEYAHWLHERDFIIEIFTRRVHPSHHDYKMALAGVYRWLEKHGFPDGLIVTAEKPNAIVYIDDRSYRFDGDWEKTKEFVTTPELYTPWTKVGNDRS